MRAAIPLGPFTDPDEVAAAAAILLGAEYVRRAVLTVDLGARGPGSPRANGHLSPGPGLAGLRPVSGQPCRARP